MAEVNITFRMRFAWWLKPLLFLLRILAVVRIRVSPMVLGRIIQAGVKIR